MTREILFKAKRKDSGKWIEGDLIKRVHYDETMYYIGFIEMTSLSKTEVIPETISEYIGLTDKNGIKIFEHDLLKDEFGFIYEVYFDDGCFMRKLGLKSTLLATTHQVFEVVGNTFDNPELLKINNKLWSESV